MPESTSPRTDVAEPFNGHRGCGVESEASSANQASACSQIAVLVEVGAAQRKVDNRSVGLRRLLAHEVVPDRRKRADPVIGDPAQLVEIESEALAT